MDNENRVEKDYGAEQIQVLEGLEHIRKRPGMYIASTDARGLHHLVKEIVDNSVDEALAGYCDTITVTINEDGSCSVMDNGRGIPTGIHEKEGVSTVEVVMTKPNAGGKFGGGGYQVSSGLHGVGLKAVNALSEFASVDVYQKGKHFRQEYDRGVPRSRLQTLEDSSLTGTRITFKPDAEIFETTEFNYDTIRSILRDFAFLNKGLKIILEDKREGKEARDELQYNGGIVEYVEYLNKNKETISDVLYFEEKYDAVSVEIAMQYNDGYNENVIAFANNVNTKEGGTHIDGFKFALSKLINDAGKKLNFVKDDDKLSGEDVREGLTAVISVKLPEPQFEGQTKTKLGNPEAKSAVEAAVTEQLDILVKNKKNKAIFDAMMKKALGALKARTAAKHAKELARATKGADTAKLIGKLSDCTSRKAELNEVFIVEGDSAGGSAKQGRDRQHQAILPLRGKPLNAEKKRIEEVLKNEEIRTIISALGTGIGADFNIANLNYDKVIILSDADQDGAHIRAILLTFFFRYMKELVQEGHVYIGMPPLYKVYKKDVIEYAYDDNELQKAIDKVGRGYQLQRYKGLGEMNPEQLWDTTMDPKKRMLMQVTIEDAAEAEKLITTLMGDDIDSRKAYISEHADFNKEDAFIDRVNV